MFYYASIHMLTVFTYFIECMFAALYRVLTLNIRNNRLVTLEVHIIKVKGIHTWREIVT